MRINRFPWRHFITPLLFLALPIVVHAQYTYITNSDAVSITITGYTGPGGEVIIPNTINGYTVTSIGASAFEGCSPTNIVIPDSVTSIGGFAFYHSDIKYITLPNSVTNIGGYAFESCTNLTSITTPSSLTSIANGEFQYCFSLTNVIIPNGVTTIGEGTFSYCTSLTHIVIPKSVTNIGDLAFSACANLTYAYFIGHAPQNAGPAFQGDPFVTVYYLPGTIDWHTTYGGAPTVEGTPPWLFTCVTNNDSITITDFTGPGESVLIPNTINGHPVTSIGGGGTSGIFPAYVTSVFIPNTITNIGDFAFEFCTNLTTAYFEGNAPPDDGTAFNGDTNAVVYYLPGTVGWTTTFGGAPAIEGTPTWLFTCITNKGSITVNGYTGPVWPVLVPGSVNSHPVTTIGVDAFEGNENLTSITIPNGITGVGQSAFLNCQTLTNISVDAASASYNGSNGVLFDKAQDTIVDYPSGLTSGSYTIPNSVTNIGFGAFAYCPSLTTIVIPGTVITIGQSAFQNCSNLTSVNIANGLANIGDDAFEECARLSNIVIPNSVISIGNSAFQDCTSIIGIAIPGSVTTIGNSAFADSALTSVTIGKGVTNIGYYPFSDCARLTNIFVDSENPSYTSLNGVLFEKTPETIVCYPTGITNASYTIPNGVTTIGPGSFIGCQSLESVIIPASVTSIAQYAFEGCENLKSTYFEGNAPSNNGNPFNFEGFTVYYLPGTAGWGTTYGGMSTQLWFQPQPTVLAFESSFGVQNNQFGFAISWATNAFVSVQACTNLTNPNWIPMTTNILSSGTNYFSDPQWANFPNRFYRVSAQ